VGLVYLLPGQYRYNLSDWCIDELLEPLAEAHVPVMVCQYEIAHSSDRGDQTDWNAVVAMCKRWPKLPVIVTEWRVRRSQRLIYKALDACENLHIEMSGYFLHRGVEYITRRWGSNRLVFGSNWPDFNHGQTYAVLTRAEVSDEDKRAIAGDNMRRLMAWCEPKHPTVRMKPASDAFVAMGRGGRVPAGFHIRDCHGHVGGKACHYHLPDGTLEQTVAEMDRHGVDKACVFSFSGVFSDEKYGNDIVANVVKRYPDRFVGFTLVNPHRGQDEMRRELERCAKKGLRGVKLIPHYHGYPEAGPNIEVACRWAHERRQIVLNHDWGEAKTLERFMSRYHDACYVIGHSFHFEWYMDQFRRYPNLFLCSCPLWEGPRDCERVVSAIGADRLMFGSDLQDLPIAWGLGPILFARIKPEEKKLILGDNLKQILARYSLEA